MLGHVTTIMHKNNLVLSNSDPGAGRTSTKKVKIGNLPNIFDDDCRWEIWFSLLRGFGHDKFWGFRDVLNTAG